MSEPLVTRFAPSPTGHLHLGHLAHMVYLWETAEKLGARVLLRMEDHDRGRCRPEYEDSILEDLEWLGFPYEHPDGKLYRQSDHPERYEAALARLAQTENVFPCTCSRKQIAQDSPVPNPDGERKYSGRCRDRRIPAPSSSAAQPAPKAHGLRLQLSPGLETFEDAVQGPQSQDPHEQVGDLLLRDREGNWTYQFAVTVDDIEQGVNLIIRGEDLLPSTGRQLRLARLLGRQSQPQFHHHPVLRDPSGQKLSKRDHSTTLRELRSSGLSREEARLSGPYNERRWGETAGRPDSDLTRSESSSLTTEDVYEIRKDEP